MTRRCRDCGLDTIGPPASRAELLALIVKVRALLAQEVPRPLPPSVQTYEQLHEHRAQHEARIRGYIEAALERVIDPEVLRICFDCSHRRFMAELAALELQRWAP